MNILLVDDHDIIREGLRNLLEGITDLKVVAEGSSGREAISLAETHKPCMIIMDVSMADMNGVEATKEIKQKHPQIKILALSMHDDRRFIMEMIRSGASGYMLKNRASKEIAAAVDAIKNGRQYFSPQIMDVVMEELMHPTEEPGMHASKVLTPREREVLQLLAEGESAKDIAYRFSLSTKTIDSHRKNIMHKLDTHSIAELTKYAIREGLITL